MSGFTPFFKSKETVPVSPDIQDANGRTALYYAVRINSPEIVSLLLKKATPSDFLNTACWVARHYIYRERVEDETTNILSKLANSIYPYSKSETAKILSKLRKKGIDPYLYKEDCLTALPHVVTREDDHAEIMHLFLEKRVAAK